MIGGFRYFAGGMMLIILVFAVISLWPLLGAMLSPAAPPGSQPVANAAPSQPATTPPPAAAPQAQARRTPPPAYTFTEDVETTPPRPGWLYARESVVLRVEPGGQGFPPVCLNFEPLTIAKGTRVWPRETRGDWVMIKSPGGRLGWVEVDLLDKRRPMTPGRD